MVLVQRFPERIPGEEDTSRTVFAIGQYTSMSISLIDYLWCAENSGWQ
jgi:hypothetical protein